MIRRPLDRELVRRGLAEDIMAARCLIDDARVRVGGAPADNPARQVGPSESVAVVPAADRFVSRGGDKLWGAMEAMGLDVTDARVLDAGASTGGFTDVVLQRGARSVLAVDVGRGQLHERLRQDQRVTVLDRTNLRLVDPDSLGRFDWVVGDLSFISLGAVLPTLLAVCEPGAGLLLLVKPQFEADRDVVDAGRGIISDPTVWRRALRSTVDVAASYGALVVDVVVSPITGARGNVEFFLHLRRPDHTSQAVDRPPSGGGSGGEPAGRKTDAQGDTPGPDGLDELVDRAVSMAVELFVDSAAE